MCSDILLGNEWVSVMEYAAQNFYISSNKPYAAVRRWQYSITGITHSALNC